FAPTGKILAGHRFLFVGDAAEGFCGHVKPAPLRSDRPCHAESPFHDAGLPERFAIVHERRKMRAAGHQASEIESPLAPITGDSNPQRPRSGRAYLCHSRHVVFHRDYLWNSSHSAASSAPCCWIQRRACLNTFAGAPLASKSPFEIRTLAANPAP